MEFKDKLKKLRKDRRMTQAQLAEAIFVSRSTVAKWENGLGLPGKASMEALEALFAITWEEMATTEPEQVLVTKNRKLYILGQAAFWASMLALMAVLVILPFAIRDGSYGFTPEMAAGNYADRDFIDTGDYRIYYFQFEGDWEDGRHWSSLQGWRPVRVRFWGSTVSGEDYSYRVITRDNYVVGRLYSIKGRSGYYNLIQKAGRYKASETPGEPAVWDIPAELITAETVTISGREYALEDGFFFITEEPVEWFRIGESWYDVE